LKGGEENKKVHSTLTSLCAAAREMQSSALHHLPDERRRDIFTCRIQQIFC